MSMCEKTKCKIYRDKKYCSKAADKMRYGAECDCRHACRACEVNEECSMKGFCDGVSSGNLSEAAHALIGAMADEHARGKGN